ncbi:hypothetical protein LX36DRAFT_419299 [Colletotrichum falcatum]|nr:hypothetical protein LX36DRAFT_419299 [Colletotrichum falcatum]
MHPICFSFTCRRRTGKGGGGTGGGISPCSGGSSYPRWCILYVRTYKQVDYFSSSIRKKSRNMFVIDGVQRDHKHRGATRVVGLARWPFLVGVKDIMSGCADSRGRHWALARSCVGVVERLIRIGSSRSRQREGIAVSRRREREREAIAS